MGKSFELDSARLMVGAAAIAGTMALTPTPADAGAGGGGQTAFVSDEFCTICTGNINTNTPSSAIVSMIGGDPTNPTDQQNIANWGDIYFAFGGGTSWQLFSSDEPGESPLPQASINEILSLLAASAPVAFEPEDFTTVDLVQFGTFQFETEVIGDSDGPAPVGVPEPASGALLGAGVAALALSRRKIALRIRPKTGAAALQNESSISIGGV